MHFDATFFAFVGLVIFLALIVYLKVPGMVAKSLDARADQIRNDLSEAKRLREEAQQLLAEYQRKRKEAEADAAKIVAAAEREAEMIAAEAKQKTEEFVARRNALSEQKIKRLKPMRSMPCAPPRSISPLPQPKRFWPPAPTPPCRPTCSARPWAK